MANNVTALNTAVGNGAAGVDPAVGNDALVNLGGGNAAGDTGDGAGEWVSAFCQDYGGAMLLAGQIFLYVGLALAIAVAAIEIYVAIKTANQPTRSDGEQSKETAALPSLSAVIEALRSLLTALSSARIWLALTILGLLLLWMAATAPWLCGTGGGCDADGNVAQTNAAENATQNAAENEATNATGNGTAPAKQNPPRPPGG